MPALEIAILAQAAGGMTACVVIHLAYIFLYMACKNLLQCAHMIGDAPEGWEALPLSRLIDSCLSCQIFRDSLAFQKIDSLRQSGALLFSQAFNAYVTPEAECFIVSMALEMLDDLEYRPDCPDHGEEGSHVDPVLNSVNGPAWPIYAPAFLLGDTREDLPQLSAGDLVVQGMLEKAGVLAEAESRNPIPAPPMPNDREIVPDRRYPGRPYSLPRRCGLLKYGLGVMPASPIAEGAPIGRRPDDELCGTLQVLDSRAPSIPETEGMATKWREARLDGDLRVFKEVPLVPGGAKYLGVDDNGAVGLVARKFRFRCSPIDELVVAEPDHPHLGKALCVDYSIGHVAGATRTPSGLGRIRWPDQWCRKPVNIVSVGAQPPD